MEPAAGGPGGSERASTIRAGTDLAMSQAARPIMADDTRPVSCDLEDVSLIE